MTGKIASSNSDYRFYRTIRNDKKKSMQVEATKSIIFTVA